MEKLNKIRFLMKDKEDLSYEIIDELIDILERQDREIAEIKAKIKEIKCH